MLLLIGCSNVMTLQTMRALGREQEMAIRSAVFQAGVTRRERARQARQLLEKVKANIIGVVLNGAHVEQSYGY